MCNRSFRCMPWMALVLLRPHKKIIGDHPFLMGEVGRLGSFYKWMAVVAYESVVTTNIWSAPSRQHMTSLNSVWRLVYSDSYITFSVSWAVVNDVAIFVCKVPLWCPPTCYSALQMVVLLLLFITECPEIMSIASQLQNELNSRWCQWLINLNECIQWLHWIMRQTLGLTGFMLDCLVTDYRANRPWLGLRVCYRPLF